MPDKLEPRAAAAPKMNGTAWSAFASVYAELETRTLTLDNVDAWLQDWSEAEKAVKETGLQLARLRNEDTRNKGAEAAHLKFIREVMPEANRVEDRLRQKLLTLEGFTPNAEQERFVMRFQHAADRYRESNVPVLRDTAAKASEYNTRRGGLSVLLGGKKLTMPQAQKRFLEPDRTVREQAYRAVGDARLSISRELDALFLELLELRRSLAKNAGLADYRLYRWREMGRVDYTPEDNLALHEAILQGVVPFVTQLYEERKDLLELDELRPWDLDVDPYGSAPLKPFNTALELEEGVLRIFEQLDPDLARQFGSLREGWLDLETREGKVPGLGYHAFFPKAGKSYIFMSAAGTHQDVITLCHEAGHAFHAMTAASEHALIWNRFPGSEFGELASQAMELLVLPYLSRSKGGFYTDAEATRARRKGLERIILILPGLALRDAFQHWLYSDAPESVTVADLDGKWRELSETFMPGVDWTGLEPLQAKGWQQLHIFTMPFYMLEYAYAYLGAVQLWQTALEDPRLALASYRAALALGGTRSIPELYAVAGATFLPTAKEVAELMAFVFRQR